MTYDTNERVETHEHVEPVREPVSDQVNVNAPTGHGHTVAVSEPSPLAPVRRVIWLLFGVLVALIGIRILFLALGANADNGIVSAIYNITEPLVAPFRGIFSFEHVQLTGRSAIDVAAFVAIIGWTLVALLITAILRIPDRSTA
jgi:uncharacterized protein YggT (Ycf19 family)